MYELVGVLKTIVLELFIQYQTTATSRRIVYLSRYRYTMLA